MLDTPTAPTFSPIPSEKDIEWLLKGVQGYLHPSIYLSRKEVLSAWSGIRPLVRDPKAANTAAIVRNHMIYTSPSGLITIAGGKWTTYRAMAQETIDVAIETFGKRFSFAFNFFTDLKPSGPCTTQSLVLVGAHNWSRHTSIELMQHYGLDMEVAKHLSDSYGDRAWDVAAMAALTGRKWPVHGKRLREGYPYIEAEVRHAVQSEYACTAIVILLSHNITFL